MCRCLQLATRNPLVNKKNLIDLIGVLLMALLVLVGYKLSPMLLPKADLTVSPDPACDLQAQACAVSLPSGGTATLDFATRPVPLVTPFDVLVDVQGTESVRVAVDFSGIEMNMGLIRPELAPKGNGRFAAATSLPICVTGAMDWQVTVLVETARQRIAIPFRLRTLAHKPHV